MGDKADQKRFYDLAWPHMAAVLRTAQCLTQSSADAEDLAQDTMLKAFKAINTLRDESKIKAWLMNILRHARIDRIRAAKDEMSLDELELEPARNDSDDQPDHDGFWRDPEEVLNSFGDAEVIRALRELPKEIRWTLLLADVEGMDQHEAAEVLGIPVGTVKSRLHRGRAMLRGCLKNSCLVPSAKVLEPALADTEGSK